tara:strand:+ start:25440 stop:25604 length:165 start_codon:yes stop_codon:yes gene_type:complete
MPLDTYELTKKVEGIKYNAETDTMFFGATKVIADGSIDDIKVDFDHSVSEVRDE